MAADSLSKKEPWIDIVKWIACMLVLLGHFSKVWLKAES